MILIYSISKINVNLGEQKQGKMVLKERIKKNQGQVQRIVREDEGILVIPGM